MHNQVKLGAVFTTTHPVTRRAFLIRHSTTKKRPALWAGAPWLAQNPEAIPLIGTSVRAVTLAMAAKSIADLAPRDAVVTAGILKTASVTADHQDSATNIASNSSRGCLARQHRGYRFTSAVRSNDSRQICPRVQVFEDTRFGDTEQPIRG